MYIVRGLSIEDLLQKIRQKLKLQQNQVISSITGRVSSGNRKYAGFDLTDDEDIHIFLGTFVQNSTTSQFVELYVDIETSDEMSTPTRGLDLNSQTQMSSSSVPQPTQSTIAHGDESDYMVDVEPDNEEEEEDEDTLLANDHDQNDSDGGDDEHHDNPITQETVIPASNNAVIPPTSDVTPFWDDIPHYEAVNLDYPNEDILDVEGLGRGQWTRGDKMYVKQEFRLKSDVQAAIKHYCMNEHQEAVVVESTTTKLSMKCRKHEEGCNWRVRAIKPKNSNSWVVTKWGGKHSCVSTTLSQDNKQLDSQFISEAILDMVKASPSVAVILIQERVTALFGYNVSYRKAWKGKQKAIAKIYGDWDESYAFLPRWFAHMLNFSPGSVYHIQHGSCVMNGQVITGSRVFQRVFWTFGQCREAFKWCKPVIQVDGTHLYGKYKGTLLIATAQDGNNEVLPIAFAVVESETKDAWEYFLASIRMHVTSKTGISLISDRHKSILSAVANPDIGWQPPNAYHVFCLRHVGSNFNTRFKDQYMKGFLKKLGYVANKDYFDAAYAEFCSISPEVATWIEAVPKEKWTRSYDEGGRRYGHMTTNLSESVNRVFKGARNMPITSLVKCTYSRLARYFFKRGCKAQKDVEIGKHFSNVISEAMTKNNERATSMRVREYNVARTSFEVDDQGSTFSVNLTDRKCQCGKFQAFKIPCSHVIASCKKVALDVEQYVDPVFSVTSIMHVYSSPFLPIGSEDGIPPHPGPKLVPDVSMMRGQGRPKSTRIRNKIHKRQEQ
ncbi:uncharacterized protein LOC133308503 [Gastrolobium bilobum]|uniref:uncharacterized protein LOC133308503 n=1 Tax=Gastrolobium bilobum TaxID=150636 RepID=UPI002AAF3B4D|nr:uncharacterized protein LOC133308503 [Gastrolobium bilobum]